MNREYMLTVLYNRDCLLCGKTERKMCFIAPMSFCNECMKKEIEQEGDDPEKIFWKHIDDHKDQVLERSK